MQRAFRVAIDERLEAMASLAALQFDPTSLSEIGGRESVGTQAYANAVRALQRIRSEARNIHFAYILRRTSDPNTMEFVADADSLHPDVPYDLNGDGVINDEDALTYPGDPYDVSAFPEFRAAAFNRTFVDPDFTSSQWGLYLSGTAPIRDPADATKPTEYAIGLDLDVTQYQIMVRQIFVPFLAFIAFLLVIIAFQALALRSLWRRQVRQLAEIDRQKDELIGIVAHQLANPITAIRWNLEEFTDGSHGVLSGAGRETINGILRATQGLSDLTSLLLDVSRIELGRLKMDKSEVELNPYLTDLLRTPELLAREKGVRFAAEMPTNLGVGFLDRRLTRMTLENLLTNAVKYTPAEGTVRFAVTLEDGTLQFVIADTGIGIPANDQPKVFEKLFRASNVGRINGNGFGLYVAKGAIEQQGGRLWFESREARGTTFHVELPISKPRVN